MSGKREFPPVGLGHAESKQGSEWASPNVGRGDETKATQLSFDHVLAGSIEAAHIQGSILDVPAEGKLGFHVTQDGTAYVGDVPDDWVIRLQQSGELDLSGAALETWAAPTDSFPTVVLGNYGAVIGVQWGPGGASNVDANLYRSGADALKTDDRLEAADSMTVRYLTGAGKRVPVDADFLHTPPNGTIAVVNDTTAGQTILCARGGGVWKGVLLTTTP